MVVWALVYTTAAAFFPLLYCFVFWTLHVRHSVSLFSVYTTAAAASSVTAKLLTFSLYKPQLWKAMICSIHIEI